MRSSTTTFKHNGILIQLSIHFPLTTEWVIGQIVRGALKMLLLLLLIQRYCSGWSHTLWDPRPCVTVAAGLTPSETLQVLFSVIDKTLTNTLTTAQYQFVRKQSYAVLAYCSEADCSVRPAVCCDVEFHAALNAMKSTMVRDSRGRSISEYHLITSLHRFRLAPAAHNGAAFLTWHREYCHRFIATSISCSRSSLSTFQKAGRMYWWG